jgi:hypothetical protein
VAVLALAYQANPMDLAILDVLTDALMERDDPRERWVRRHRRLREKWLRLRSSVMAGCTKNEARRLERRTRRLDYAFGRMF